MSFVDASTVCSAPATIRGYYAPSLSLSRLSAALGQVRVPARRCFVGADAKRTCVCVCGCSLEQPALFGCPIGKSRRTGENGSATPAPASNWAPTRGASTNSPLAPSPSKQISSGPLMAASGPRVCPALIVPVEPRTHIYILRPSQVAPVSQHMRPTSHWQRSGPALRQVGFEAALKKRPLASWCSHYIQLPLVLPHVTQTTRHKNMALQISMQSIQIGQISCSLFLSLHFLASPLPFDAHLGWSRPKWAAHCQCGMGTQSAGSVCFLIPTPIPRLILTLTLPSTSSGVRCEHLNTHTGRYLTHSRSARHFCKKTSARLRNTQLVDASLASSVVSCLHGFTRTPPATHLPSQAGTTTTTHLICIVH